LIQSIPVLRSIAEAVYFSIIAPFKSFPGSEEYWRRRYRSGGNSGAGSSRKLGAFKAEVLNSFVSDKQIRTVIEYGCGDGSQLRLAEYRSYMGLDVSPDAIAQCRKIFSGDESKTFKLMDEYTNETAQLTLSLDVVYHLVEDSIFNAYMNRLFDSSTDFVIIYSSNTDKQEIFQAAHIKHRKFTQWIEQNRPEWRLIEHIPNRYAYDGNEQDGSFADFYLYKKA